MNTVNITAPVRPVFMGSMRIILESIEPALCQYYFFCDTIIIVSAVILRNTLTIKTRCTNFSDLFWNRTLHVLDRFTVHHQESSTVYTAIDICHTSYAGCLQARSEWNSTRLLLMDSKPVRKM
jgi:hypothetical protein